MKAHNSDKGITVATIKAARMLRQMAREADDLARKIERQIEAPILRIEAERPRPVFAHTLLAPAPNRGHEAGGDVAG